MTAANGFIWIFLRSLNDKVISCYVRCKGLRNSERNRHRNYLLPTRVTLTLYTPSVLDTRSTTLIDSDFFKEKHNTYNQYKLII